MLVASDLTRSASKLRLRAPAGVSTVQIPSTATLLELRASVLAATGIQPDRQQLRVGVPPKPLDTSAGEYADLAALGIRSGDVIIVQEGEAIASAPKPTTIKATTVSAPQISSPLSPSKTAAEEAVADSAYRTPHLSGGYGSNTVASKETSIGAPAKDLSSRGKEFGYVPSNDAPQQASIEPFGGANSNAAKRGPSSTEGAHVMVDGGWVVLRVVPDDNSCMFTALAIVLEHDQPGMPQKLRESVAKAIQNDPFKWSEAVLGKPPAKYCEHIQRKTSWGGAIELAILSELYKTEIDSFDVQSGRTDRFGEEHNYPNRVVLMYSGIHYDAVTFTPLEPDPAAKYPYSLDFDQTVFSSDTDGYVLAAGFDLAQKLKRRHYYTDTARFALRCEICKEALKGEKEAQAHAMKTGHATFGEY